jgi:hypothetical protein
LDLQQSSSSHIFQRAQNKTKLNKENKINIEANFFSVKVFLIPVAVLKHFHLLEGTSDRFSLKTLGTGNIMC